jgi:hypothetical protein
VPTGDFFAGVSFDTPADTLEKATLKLAGRYPTEAELSILGDTGDVSLALSPVFQDEAFFVRVQELYNDLFLTDRAMGVFKLINHLSGGDYPNRYFFRDYDPSTPHYNKLQYTCASMGAFCKGGTCCSGEGNNPYPEVTCTQDGLSYDFCAYGDLMGVTSLRREAMALISHTVENDLNFTNILTADYTMVNPYTAEMYRIQSPESWENWEDNPPSLDGASCDTGGTAYWTSTNSVSFDDPCNAHEYKPIQLQMHNGQGVSENNTYVSAKVPHAGVLSTHTFLNRYMTTSTNLNRQRAKLAYKLFLDVDIEQMVQFTVNQSEVMPENPTWAGKVCQVCHSAMDPVAGAFHKWLPNGQVRSAREWYSCNDYLDGFSDCSAPSDCAASEKCSYNKCLPEESLYDPALCTRPIGFRGIPMPETVDKAPLRWVTEQMANDERFPYAQVKNLFGLLTSQDLLGPPTDLLDVDYVAHVQAYIAQEEELERITAVFDNGLTLNLKDAVREIILSPYFRAADGDIASDDIASKVIGQVGGGRMLTPEILTRKIKDRTGFVWQDFGLGRGDALLKGKDGFRLLYGGIDSDSIVHRSRDPFPVSTAIARRMANQMACITVPQDFAWNDMEERRFFELVTVDTVPQNENEQPINVDVIKLTIQKMHRILLGEELPISDPEIERSYNLFVSVWQLGQGLMALPSGDPSAESANLPNPCKATTDMVEYVPFAQSSNPNRSTITTDDTYVIRSWMAVFSYLMSDAKFLFE